MPPTLGFIPFVHSSESESAPAARPLLDVCHSFMAPGVAQPPIALSDSPVPGCDRPSLSRCRLRIFRNGHLGRAYDWAVVFTELPAAPVGNVSRLENPGTQARASLDQLATEIKRLHLLRVPCEQIIWFYHEAHITCSDRPRPHSLVHRILFSRRQALGKDVYFGFCLDAVSHEDLELAAGGMIEL